MRKNYLFLWLFLESLIGLSLHLGAAPPAPGEDGEIVLVSLRPRVAVTDPFVEVGEVAEVKGGPPDLREKIARLDLAELPRAGQKLAITRDQISYRIQIAGVEPKRLRLVGPDQTLVTLTQQKITPDTIADAARRLIQQRLPAGAEEVSIQMVQPPIIPVLDVKPGDHVRLGADMRNPPFPAGRVRVEVNIILNGQRRGAAAVGFDVSFTLPGAVARRRVSPGEILREDNLSTQRRLVDSPELPLTVAECLGKRCRVTLVPGQRIGDADLDSAPAEEMVLVKARDTVRLVARVGAFRVTTLGEALQDGRSGQIIRVRNVDSNKIVSGRVADRGQVDVEY